MSGITNALKSAVERVVTSAESVDRSAEETGTDFLDRVGDRVLGPTAESEYNNAPVIAPDASTQPIAVGRRSLRPDGQDPYHNQASKPAPAPQAAPAPAPANTS